MALRVACFMDTNPASNPDQYPEWINRRIGEEVRRRREALGKSAYALAIRGKLSDQTILNIERGHCGATMTMLALVCVRLGTTVSELLAAAEGRE